MHYASKYTKMHTQCTLQRYIGNQQATQKGKKLEQNHFSLVLSEEMIIANSKIA